MAPQRRQGAIDLFGQQNAASSCGKVMGGKRNQQVGAGAPAGGQAIVAAYQEDQIPALHFGFWRSKR